MDTATAGIAEILESEKLETAEIERLRKAAHASEDAWGELRAALAQPLGKNASLARRVLRGAGLLTLGKAKEAVKELDDAKAVADPVGALVLGRAHAALGEWKKAAEAFEAGLKKSKSDFDLQAAAIDAARELGDAAGALKDAQALLKKNGDRAEAHVQVGRALEALGDYDAAMDCYEEALERDPEHACALFRLAYQHELRGMNEIAESYYARLSEQAPTYPSALINYGLMLEDKGRYKEAIELYHKVLSVRPTHPRARMFLKDAEASLDMYYDEDQEKKSDRRNAILRIPVTDFELSVRARNCLNKMNIRNLGDLVTKTEEELLAYKNFGETSLQEIKQMLAQKSLRLGMFREGTGVAAAPAAPAVEEQKRGDEETLKKPISELELSVRSRNCMERLNIRTIGELVQKSEPELLAVKNFGTTSLNEIKQRLGELGLSLAQDSTGAGGAAALLGLTSASFGASEETGSRSVLSKEDAEVMLGGEDDDDDDEDDRVPADADADEDE